MDILGADLVLKNEFDEWVKTKKNTRKKAAKKVSSKKKNDEEEPGFHYVAYVPVQGEVWRLDGLQRDPVNLGMPDPLDSLLGGKTNCDKALRVIAGSV